MGCGPSDPGKHCSLVVMLLTLRQSNSHDYVLSDST
jgi:hypothetical protein